MNVVFFFIDKDFDSSSPDLPRTVTEDFLENLKDVLTFFLGDPYSHI